MDRYNIYFHVRDDINELWRYVEWRDAFTIFNFDLHEDNEAEDNEAEDNEKRQYYYCCSLPYSYVYFRKWNVNSIRICKFKTKKKTLTFIIHLSL